MRPTLNVNLGYLFGFCVFSHSKTAPWTTRLLCPQTMPETQAPSPRKSNIDEQLSWCKLHSSSSWKKRDVVLNVFFITNNQYMTPRASGSPFKRLWVDWTRLAETFQKLAPSFSEKWRRIWSVGPFFRRRRGSWSCSRSRRRPPSCRSCARSAASSELRCRAESRKWC